MMNEAAEEIEQLRKRDSLPKVVWDGLSAHTNNPSEIDS
jgi:hypothetical protein